jgi:DNA-binding XRE family transcriptional regulator
MGMTQRELAENLQVREHTVASWENERLPIRKITQMAVLHLLNTSGKNPKS